MCGIYGKFTLVENNPSDADLESKIQTLHHRGPDETGFWRNDCLSLAHKRLALLDLDSGKQPMISGKGNVLIYTGEIYNNLELRAQLSVYGYPFSTVSDTELILAAYEIWGEESWRKFNGMFAFALYDRSLDKLYLVRDRFGLKPLYHKSSNASIEFASEPSALHNHEALQLYNEEGIINFLHCAHIGTSLGNLTKDISVLQPGSQYVISKGKQEITKWWSPQTELSDTECVDRAKIRYNIRYLLERAVSRQGVADANIGVFLSGGLDSALIALLYTQIAAAQVHSYTVALEGDTEELLMASAVAGQCNAQHHELVVGFEEFFATMRLLINKRRLPLSLPNEVLIYLLSLEARKEVKAVLCGEGADELFGGYSYLVSKMLAYQKAVLPVLFGEPLYKQAIQTEFPDTDFTDSKSFFLNLYSWFKVAELESCLQPNWKLYTESARKTAINALPLGSFNKLSPQNNIYATLEFFHLPLLLSRLDGSAMAASLEGRLPFTDNDLVEYVSGLPSEVKFSIGTKSKKILREAFEDILPKKTLSRPKKAFHIPLNTLFGSEYGKHELQNMFKNKDINNIFNIEKLQALLNSNTTEDRNMKLWLLLSLSMWMESNTM